MTTADYLNQLEQDRSDLVDNLETQGITGLTGDETFTELVPEVLNISGGGSITLTDASYLFYSGARIDKLNDIIGMFRNVTKTNSMFYSCYTLTTAPSFDLSHCTDANNMFNNCNNLTSIPVYNYNSCNNLTSYLQNCSKLENVEFSNTSNVTNMSNMFSYCNKLKTVTGLDTSNVTNMSNMFANCLNLESVPNFDTSNVTAMSSMFQNVLRYAPLTTIPEFDCGKVINISNIFYSQSNNTTLTTLGGFKDLGKAYLTTASANYVSYTLDISKANGLTHDSLMNVINKLYDIASKGCNIQKLVLGTTNLSKLTSDEIAIATNKGWAVS